LRGMLEVAGIEPSKQSDALVALDKIDKIGADGVAKEFEERGIAGSSLLLDLFGRLDGTGNPATLAELSTFLGDNQSGIASMQDLQELLSLSASTRLKLDPSLARGLSYYTGTIMEINVPDLAGSLGGGGRYDGLIGMFGKDQIPACGFSLGLERILVVMEERRMFPAEIAESTPADVMVTIFDEHSINESLMLANELRSAGLRVTVYPEPDKFGKQMKYADAIKVPYVAILGENEIVERKVKVKNMTTGEEELVARSDAAVAIRDALLD
jgi:histidyl-tRNA synthetase